MTHYAPCTGCAVDPKTCPTRAALRRALVSAKAAGAALYPTVIRGKCKARVPTFPPGRRVMVRTYIHEPVMTRLAPGEDRVYDWWPGVVCSEKGSRATVYVATSALSEGGERFVPKGIGFIKIAIRHLRPIAGAPLVDLTVCKVCNEIVALLDGECGAPSDHSKVRCQHVPAQMFFDGGMALVGTAWVDPNAKQEWIF